VSLALTYLPNYRRIWQPMITAAILFSGPVWVIHRAFVAEGRSDWGYAGNMLILIFAYILSRLQFRYSALAGVALIVMHNVGAFLFTNDLDDRHRLRRLLPPHHGVHRLGRCVRAGALAATAVPA
jgi:hypothetical protein